MPLTARADAVRPTRGTLLVASRRALSIDVLTSCQVDGITVHQCASEMDLAADTTRHRPTIVAIDAEVCHIRSQAVHALRQQQPDVRVLVIRIAPRDVDVLDLLRSGAHGILPEGELGRFVECVRALERGEYWIPRKHVAELVHALGWPGPAGRVRPMPSDERNALTAREREVCVNVAFGLSNKEIASVLSIAEQTVKHHLTSVFVKTGLRGRVAVALAFTALGG